jgi:hypothetical protein
MQASKKAKKDLILHHHHLDKHLQLLTAVPACRTQCKKIERERESIKRTATTSTNHLQQAASSLLLSEQIHIRRLHNRDCLVNKSHHTAIA